MHPRYGIGSTKTQAYDRPDVNATRAFQLGQGRRGQVVVSTTDDQTLPHPAPNSWMYTPGNSTVNATHGMKYDTHRVASNPLDIDLIQSSIAFKQSDLSGDTVGLQDATNGMYANYPFDWSNPNAQRQRLANSSTNETTRRPPMVHGRYVHYGAVGIAEAFPPECKTSLKVSSARTRMGTHHQRTGAYTAYNHLA